MLQLAGPPQAGEFLRQGLTALQAGHLETAQSDLERAAVLDKTNAYVWSSLAETHRRRGQRQDALQAAARAERLGAGDPIVAHSLAIFYTQMGQPAKAAPLEYQFAVSGKADPDALTRAASLYLNGNDPRTAIEIARQALEVGQNAAAENTLGRALEAIGQDGEASSHVRRAFELDGVNSSYAFDYAQSLMRAQDFEAAAAIARQAIARNPRDTQMLLVEGVCRYGQRRFPEAIQAFLNVTRVDPSIDQPYVFLGKLLDQAGPAIDEIVAADRAYWLAHPKDGGAALRLGKALLTKDSKGEEAHALLERSIALDRDSWEAQFEIGSWLEAHREWDSARMHLERSILLDARQPLPHYHLARVYARLGREGDAERERQQHAALTGHTDKTP